MGYLILYYIKDKNSITNSSVHKRDFKRVTDFLLYPIHCTVVVILCSYVTVVHAQYYEINIV